MLMLLGVGGVAAVGLLWLVVHLAGASAVASHEADRLIEAAAVQAELRAEADENQAALDATARAHAVEAGEARQRAADAARASESATEALTRMRADAERMRAEADALTAAGERIEGELLRCQADLAAPRECRPSDWHSLSD